jgi:hypothetical protein
MAVRNICAASTPAKSKLSMLRKKRIRLLTKSLATSRGAEFSAILPDEA